MGFLQLQPSDFWILTPAELDLMVDGELDRRDDEIEMIRLSAFLNGRLNIYAFNDPDKFPSYDQAFGQPKAIDVEAVQEDAEAKGLRGPLG